jgi:hypothetical protein
MAEQVVRQIMILSGCAVALMACGRSPPPTDRLYPPQELSDLLTNHTMHIGAAFGRSLNLLIYLAPDGSGWLDNQAGQVASPQISSMSMLTNWYFAQGSQFCATASPPIGVMPDIAPAERLCVQVLRPADHDTGPTAVVSSDGRYQALPLTLYPFNAFSNDKIAQYRLQVSVLFGGRIPTWMWP